MNLSAQRFTFWYRFSTGKIMYAQATSTQRVYSTAYPRVVCLGQLRYETVRVKTTSPGFVSCELKTPAMYVFCNGAATEKSGAWKQPPWRTPLGEAKVCFYSWSSEVPHKCLSGDCPRKLSSLILTLSLLQVLRKCL